MEFITVMPLGNRSDVTLIREVSTGHLYVRRIIDETKLPVYQTLHSIHAPHIPDIVCIMEIAQNRYEVIETYIEGKTLEEILTNAGVLTEEQAAFYITQLCDALAAVHKSGVIHRDIKPENIIITNDDTLYLLDFDISRIRKRGQHSDTDFIGTKGYAAPEQFGFQQTSVSTDIYAIGVVLNEMLTGQLPQEALPYGSIRRVIIRCTDIDPLQRYRSVKQLKNALHVFLPKSSAPIVRLLRQIPGFRTWMYWKMPIALSFYLLILISVIPVLQEPPTSIIILIICYIPYFLLFFFIFDCFHLRSSVTWLRKARTRFTYYIRCVIYAIGLLLVSSICLSILIQIVFS